MPGTETLIQRFRTRAVVGMQAVLIAGLVLALVLLHDRPQVVAVALAGLVVSTSSCVLALRGRIAPAATLLSMALVAIPIPLAWLARGVYDVSMLLLPAAIVAVGVIEPPRRTAVFAAVVVVAAAVIGYGTVEGWVGQPPAPSWAPRVPREVTIALVIVAFAAGVGLLVSRGFALLVAAVERHSGELEAAVAQRTHELERANADLRGAMADLEASTRELVRSEKLAALGGVVAGVTHELNTPIGNALLSASALAEDAAPIRRAFEAGTLRRSELGGFLEQTTTLAGLVVRSLERANDLTRSFKRVAVDQSSERRRTFELDAVVEDVLQATVLGLGRDAPRIIAEIPPGLVMDSYPGPLGQVLANLVQNATLHAFEPGAPGRVRVTAEGIDDRVRLVVEDDGRGIAPAHRDQVFKPFFTTRGQSGGSGLGLTICQSLVQTVLGGRIALEPATPRGTRALVDLPRVAPEPAALRSGGAASGG